METSASSIGSLCALCGNGIKDSAHLAEEQEAAFCCKGCAVVYAIVKAQGALAQFQDHPVYRQAVQAGLIANPSVLPVPPEGIPDEQFHTWHLTIDGLWCPSCAQVIHLILSREQGVRRCTVDYSTDLAVIEYTPRLISKERLTTLIQRLGYRPHVLQDPRGRPFNRDLLLRFIVAAFFSLNVMMLAYPLYAAYLEGGDADGYAEFFAWLSFIGALPVILYSGWPIWRRCLGGLKVGLWGMEALVTIGVAAATGLSLYELSRGSFAVYFDSATVIITFVLLGKLMESKAKFSAKDALLQLSSGLPRRGRKRLLSGEERFVPIKEIGPGDSLVVWTGEKIVLDGIVEEGEGTCDESLMTGESRPTSKQRGASVLAGTLLQQGRLVVKVTASLEESLLKRILDTVGQDIWHKSRYVRAADRIMRWFVPFVLALAGGTALFCLWQTIASQEEAAIHTAVIRALSVLLISCPCAIGIAAPLAESHLLNVLAKAGVMVRNRGCLPFLGRETLFVFDKTGTLTEGRFTVQSGIEILNEEGRAVLKGITAHSLHPVAVALHAALPGSSAPFEQLEEIVGKGIQGRSQGIAYCLGSAAFMRQQGFAVSEDSSTSASTIETTVYFAKSGAWMTKLALGDRLRPGVIDFIQSLYPIKTVLLSGDGTLPVGKAAIACGIQDWHAEHSPLQKRALIESWRKRGEIVAMLGDGMNDAPALTASHIGIAVVSATDVAIHVSDLLLTTPSFRVLSLLRQVSVKGQEIVKQNLFWAFFYNAVGLALAVGGLLTPIFAAFAMMVSSLIVVLNTRRLNMP